ncbi:MULTISPECIES: aminotransferase class IV [unclassified Clostridium]|uniref:aminotransferase class IV n=1 Tax=unclassified Clostridium TaxID=2614128 RepID=UPI000ECA165A|nr:MULTISPECIES: aminotransferase class IV [unclassified Clostridium]HCQ91045.1 4-amino-4-deoxychorismate lyase [Clostridium sp.]
MESKEIEQSIVLDDGYAFGKGLFETMLILKEPVFLKEHIKRLNDGINLLGIDNFISEKDIREKVEELKITNCALKIMVSEKNIIYSNRPIIYGEKHYKRGFNLKVSNYKRNQFSKTTYIKSLNYLDNILEKELALKEGFDEAIFLNLDNFLCEGSVSNLFIIKNKMIYTPKISSGLLPGIVREFLINTLRSKGYKVVEDFILLDDLKNSDGAFLTNSLMGIMKINSVDGKNIKDNKIIDEIKFYYDNYINSKYGY